jgi:histidinol-phosphatase (PHP family)
MGDYHVHLHPHGPYTGVGPAPGEYPDGHLDRFVETALLRGADEVGFTEHLYRCVESTEALGAFWESEPRRDLAEHTRRFVEEDRNLSIDRYVEVVVDARDRGLPVKLGLEVDFFPASIDAVLELLEPYPWDFLIGAIHWVGGWAVDHSGAVFEFERRGVERAYMDYFAWETALAASGAVDVLAHTDVVKKHGHRLERAPIELYRGVAAAAAASGTAVEVSTAGLHKPVGELYPAPEFLDIFYEHGVDITLASDAHRPQEAARDRHIAVAAAIAAGYTHRVRFTRRTRELVPLTREDGA